MRRHDKDIERHFDNGKRVSIDMGTEVLMQISGVAGRLPSLFVGMDASQYMIFKMPRAQVSLASKITKGCGVIIRYRYQGRIFGFQSTILGTVSEPYAVMFIRAPDVVEEHNLRKKHRIDCYFPCEVEIGEQREPGVVVNISLSGCRCIFSSLRSSRDVLAGLRDKPIKMIAEIDEQEESLVVPGRILSAQQFHGAVSAGINFDELEESTSLRLKTHMTEWM